MNKENSKIIEEKLIFKLKKKNKNSFSKLSEKTKKVLNKISSKEKNSNRLNEFVANISNRA